MLVVLAVWAAPAIARADDDEKVTVIVDADDDQAQIQRRANTVEGWQTTLGIPIFTSTEQWEPVCVAPCKVQLSPHATYRVSGRGVADSHDFVLPKGDELRLEVRARSAFWHGAGVGLTVLGGMLTAVGGISTSVAGNITSTDAEATVRSFGVTFLVAGVVMLATGVPLWITQRSAVRTADGHWL